MLRHKLNSINRHPGYNDIGGGEALGIGASLIGGMMGDDAADEASGAMVGMSKEALAEIKKIDDRTRGDTGPYRDFGEKSLGRLSYLLGLTPLGSDENGNDKYTLEDWTDAVHKAYDQAGYSYDSRGGADRWANEAYQRYLDDTTGSYSNNPMAQAGDVLVPLSSIRKLNKKLDTSDGQYGSLLKKFTQDDLDSDVVYNNGLQFGLNEGNKALDRRASAMGGWDSGATLKALSRFGNDYGTTKAQGAWDRFMSNKNSIYNMLYGGTQTGLSAVNTSANSGNMYGQAASGLMTGMGNAQAGGIMGGANAWSNALGGIGNSIGNGGIMNFGNLFGGGGNGGTSYTHSIFS